MTLTPSQELRRLALRRLVRAPLLFSLAITVALWPVLACGAQTRVPDYPFVPTASANHPPLVFTYFFYWYDLPSGPHSTGLVHRPAESNASYRSVEWFRKQLLDMEAAGIDVVLADYWGSVEPSSDVGLLNMVRAMQELRTAGHNPPKLGMFFDTGLVSGWPDSQRDLTQRVNQQRMYQLVRSFFSVIPQDQMALVDGRPVVWLWANYFGLAFDQGFFDYVSTSFNQDFRSRPYLVAETSWRYEMRRDAAGVVRMTDRAVSLDDFYEWGAALRGISTWGGIAEVGPGYDERLLNDAGRQGRVTEREDGDFYRRNLDAAIASGRRFLAIETWNEFHEGTDIADSVDFGRDYIDTTRRYVDLFRAQFTAPSSDSTPTDSSAPATDTP